MRPDIKAIRVMASDVEMVRGDEGGDYVSSFWAERVADDITTLCDYIEAMEAQLAEARNAALNDAISKLVAPASDPGWPEWWGNSDDYAHAYGQKYLWDAAESIRVLVSAKPPCKTCGGTGVLRDPIGGGLERGQHCPDCVAPT